MTTFFFGQNLTSIEGIEDFLYFVNSLLHKSQIQLLGVSFSLWHQQRVLENWEKESTKTREALDHGSKYMREREGIGM